MKKSINNIIENIKANYRPEMIMLFGSYATGKATKESDIDILLVKETDKHPIWRRVEVQLAVNANVPLDILVYTPQEFDRFIKDKNSFLYNIYTSGKIVFNKRSIQISDN